MLLRRVALALPSRDQSLVLGGSGLGAGQRRRDRSSSVAVEGALQEAESRPAARQKGFQYLQESPVRTDKFQSSLPRMPIPKLEETCLRYLLSQKPLLSPEAFAETERLVHAFKRGDGAELDAALRRRDRQNWGTSYINAPWTDMYLRDRRPLVVTHNPGILLAHDLRPQMARDMVRRPANMLISSLRFHRSLRDGLLKPEVYHLQPAKSDTDRYWRRVRLAPDFLATPLSYLHKAFPLDMTQYRNLLFSTRVPRQAKDSVESFPGARHAVVLKHGRLFAFDVFDRDGNLFPPAHYLSAFQQLDQVEPRAGNHDIGVLTSENRDVWARLRARLEGLSERNQGRKGFQSSLHLVDSALFCLCLDAHWTHDPGDEMPSVHNVVMGADPANRWFDKSFSLIFSNRGACAINFEHAWGDGVAVMRYVDEVITDSAGNDFCQEGAAGPAAEVQELEVDVDEEVSASVREARAKYLARTGSVDYSFFIQHGFGKAECKQAGIGPDALMQTGFQIAYHRLRGRVAPTYESCSTAIYRHGRTETVRPCTMETKEAAEAFNSPGKSAEDKMAALKKASVKHLDLIKLAAQGKGWDRHLFALKALASEEAGRTPDLFLDPAYASINDNIISTSTLSSQNMVNGGFVATSEEGFGVGYQIQKDMLGTCTSNFSTKTRGADFRDATQEVFKDMETVFRDLGFRRS